MTTFFLGCAFGAFLTYCATNPTMVKGWIDALRAKLGK